jgi:K+-transporting ATPase ATPase C chain
MIGKHLRPAIVLTLLLCAITGFIYPGVVTGLAQLFFSRQANGSLVYRNGHVVGSQLIGQAFTSPDYFHPRPSAAGNGYDATASAGTNKGPTDRKLADTLIAQAVDAAVKNDGAERGHVPADMATASGSGLDPHISPANAALQVARVARSRGIDPEKIRALVAAHTEGRQLGFLGDPRVNVLLLNLALDSIAPRSVPPTASSATPVAATPAASQAPAAAP